MEYYPLGGYPQLNLETVAMGFFLGTMPFLFVNQVAMVELDGCT